MQPKRSPQLERVFPVSLLDRFAEHYRRANGLNLTALGPQGNALSTAAQPEGLCAVAVLGGRQKCSAFYQRAIAQIGGSDQPLIFRCPFGFLVFGLSVRLGGYPEASVAFLGGPALSEPLSEASAAALGRTVNPEGADLSSVLSSTPVLPARRLLELAALAQFSLQAALQGNQTRETYSGRQTQVMTLFEVASDLGRVSSSHELYALALNTLGVLFDVASAAILLYEPTNDTYRVHTAMGSLERSLLSWNMPAGTKPVDQQPQPGLWARIDDPHALAKMGLPEEANSLHAFSLAGQRGLMGLLVVLNTDLSAEDEQIIEGFAVQLSLAMENQKLRTAVAEKNRELEALQDMSQRFVESLEAEALFQTILAQARRITGAQKGSLMVPSNGAGELVIKAIDGLNDRVVEKLRVPSGQGVAGRVFATGEAILVQNVEKDPRFRRKNRPRYSTKSFLSLPILSEGRTMGVVNLSDKATGEVFSDDDLRSLQSMTAQATIAIGRSTYYEQSRHLRKISITDSLTGLLNRRYFQERLAEEVDRSGRHQHPLSLMMIDIDHFKTYNDANGHPAGDKALVLVGRALRAGVRVIDVVSRFGGEEFSVILPETRKTEALEIGDRIRTEIERLYFPGEEALPQGRLTVSIGVAAFPEDADELKTLIQRADRALYHAKAQGRNTIVPYAAPLASTTPTNSAWTKVL